MTRTTACTMITSSRCVCVYYAMYKCMLSPFCFLPRCCCCCYYSLLLFSYILLMSSAARCSHLHLCAVIEKLTLYWHKHTEHTHTHSTHCKFKHDSTNRLNPPILWTKRAVSEQKRRTKLQNKQTNIFYFFIITCFGKHLRTNYMLINMWQLIINSNFILW